MKQPSQLKLLTCRQHLRFLMLNLDCMGQQHLSLLDLRSWHPKFSRFKFWPDVTWPDVTWNIHGSPYHICSTLRDRSLQWNARNSRPKPTGGFEKSEFWWNLWDQQLKVFWTCLKFYLFCYILFYWRNTNNCFLLFFFRTKLNVGWFDGLNKVW